MLLPISLPRELKALRFSSFMSFGISLFVVFSVFACCFREKEIDGDDKYDFSDRFSAAYNQPDITVAGIFNSLPLIIFAYMYQPNVPAIYHELKAKNMGNISTVLSLGTVMASVAYVLTGMFGYVTFAKRLNVDQIMNVQNILKADYGGFIIIKLCLFGVLIIVTFAAPFCVLPSKDSLEELLMKGEKFNRK